MILDALRSEILKLTKNRWSMFWAFGFVPLFTLAMGILVETFLRSSASAGPLANVTAPLNSALDGLSAFNNVFLQIFPIAGAAILFAGEYRWETWRAILPRNERSAVLLAKLIAFALAVAAGILLSGFFGWLVAVYDLIVLGATPHWPRAGAGDVILALFIAFGGSFLQVMASAALVMFTAIVSRAMIASIIAPFMILIALALAASRVRLPGADLSAAGFPSIAGTSIDQMARATLGDPDAIGVHLAVPGAGALLLWCIVLAVGALLLFSRQDLSRE
jgi:ABC-2 type transport system permease protein